MNIENLNEIDHQYYHMTEKTDEYKKNFDLIESIMELEKDLMQPERVELNCINQNIITNTSNYEQNCFKVQDSNNHNKKIDFKNETDNHSKSLNASLDTSVNSKHNMLIDNSTYVYDLEGVNIPDESTEQIAKKIKDFLIENKISQKMLAENLLNMKQANLSPILSNPKPWRSLTPIIRNRFLVMYLWLNDENRIQKLNTAMGL